MIRDSGGIVIHQDEKLLVVNKPAGITVLPDGYHPEKSNLKQELESMFGRIWVVHRLDRQTSGVIIFARDLDTHRWVNTQFQNRKVRKIYHALVIGTPSWKVKEVDMPLLVDGDRRHRTVVDHKLGKPSKTELFVREVYRGCSLVEAVPHTGRTHQIRVHLAAEGCPVACDSLYGDGEPVYLSNIKSNFHTGDRPEQPLLDRLGLHALTLALPAFGMQGTIEYTAPYPVDFKKTLLQLRKYPV